MTALDRAFVKAYLPQRHMNRRPKPAPAATAPSTVPPTPAIPHPHQPLAVASVPIEDHRVDLPTMPAAAPPCKPMEKVVPVAPPSKPAATSAALNQAEAVSFPVEPVSEFVPVEVVAEIPTAVQAASPSMQPLSAFSVTAPSEEEFKAHLEVDRFSWPAAVDRLIDDAGEGIRGFIDQLALRTSQGERMLAVIGMHRQAGCSTALLAVARQLALRGLRTAVIDAKFKAPMLAGQLGVAAAAGWEQVFAGTLPIEEVLIASVEDRLALVPLHASASTSGLAIGSLHVSVMFDLLREHFDVVLVDAGTMDELGDLCQVMGCGEAAIPDGVYLVYDRRAANEATLSEACRRLASVRLRVLGSIENFASRDTSAPRLSVVG
jgi:Mrp family chromosome partitioning ATPase